MNLSLKEFCQNAVITMAHVDKDNFVMTFIYLRYDLMSKLFPHPVFGTNRTTEFFEDTLKYLNSMDELRAAMREAVKENKPYEIRYLEWVRNNYTK